MNELKNELRIKEYVTISALDQEYPPENVIIYLKNNTDKDSRVVIEFLDPTIQAEFENQNPTLKVEDTGETTICLSFEEEVIPPEELSCDGSISTFNVKASFSQNKIEIQIDEGPWQDIYESEGPVSVTFRPGNPGADLQITLEDLDTHIVRLRTTRDIGLYVNPTSGFDQITNNKAYRIYSREGVVIDPTNPVNHDYTGKEFDDTSTTEDFAVYFAFAEFCLSPETNEISCEGAIPTASTGGIWGSPRVWINGSPYQMYDFKGLLDVDTQYETVFQWKNTSSYTLRVEIEYDSGDVYPNDDGWSDNTNPTMLLDTDERRIQFCLIPGEIVEDPCENATNISGCINLEGTWDLEIDGEIVLQDASELEISEYISNGNNMLSLGEICCDMGYYRPVSLIDALESVELSNGDTVYIPIALTKDGPSITSPITINASPNPSGVIDWYQIGIALSAALDAQLSPHGLHSNWTNNFKEFGVTNYNAVENRQDVKEFYILNEGNTFFPLALRRGLPPIVCVYPS